MLFGHVERQLVVLVHVVAVQRVPVDQMGAVVVNNGAEAEAVAPARRHVEYVDLGVRGGDVFAPGLQGFGSVQRHLVCSSSGGGATVLGI